MRQGKGRPPLSSSVPGFLKRLKRLMPALQQENLSKGEAARTLNVSRRSLRRYMEWLEQEQRQ